MELYVATNANANANILEEKDIGGNTALHIASFWDDFEIVKCLVESGSDIEAVSNGGQTPIDVARTKEIKDFLTEQLEIQQNRYLLK